MVKVIDCLSANGACVQCPEKSCRVNYHPECARRAKVFMGFGYMNYPYWRIYCEHHAELEIVQKLEKTNLQNYVSILKFARSINRQADLHVKPEQFPPKEWKKIVYTHRAKRKNVKDLVVQTYLSSFSQSNSKQDPVVISLSRDREGRYQLQNKEEESDIHEDTNGDQKCEDGQLGKRKVKTKPKDLVIKKTDSTSNKTQRKLLKVH